MTQFATTVELIVLGDAYDSGTLCIGQCSGAVSFHHAALSPCARAQGIAGAYPVGTGSMRRVWIFRLSELATAFEKQNRLIPKSQKCVTIQSGSLRAERIK